MFTVKLSGSCSDLNSSITGWSPWQIDCLSDSGVRNAVSRGVAIICLANPYEEAWGNKYYLQLLFSAASATLHSLPTHIFKKKNVVHPLLLLTMLRLKLSALVHELPLPCKKSRAIGGVRCASRPELSGLDAKYNVKP